MNADKIFDIEVDMQSISRLADMCMATSVEADRDALIYAIKSLADGAEKRLSEL